MSSPLIVAIRLGIASEPLLMKMLSDIAAVPGVDVLLIGSSDLTAEYVS